MRHFGDGPSIDGLEPASPGRPAWLIPVLAAAVALVAGGVAGYWFHHPEQRTRVVTRTVEVTPPSCGQALASASAMVEDVGRVPGMVADALEAVQALDLVRLEDLGDQARALAEEVQGEASRAGLAIVECRSKLRSEPG